MSHLEFAFLIFYFEVEFGKAQSPSNGPYIGVVNNYRTMTSGVIGEHCKPPLHEVRSESLWGPQKCDTFLFGSWIEFSADRRDLDQKSIFFQSTSVLFWKTRNWSHNYLCHYQSNTEVLLFVERGRDLKTPKILKVTSWYNILSSCCSSWIMKQNCCLCFLSLTIKLGLFLDFRNLLDLPWR